MTDTYICAPLRTPIGRFQGSLSGTRPDDLAAHVLRSVVKATHMPGDEVEDVFMGCANQAGEDNRNIARMATLLAGLPQSVPGVTVNRLCASGLEAVIQAYRATMCGHGEVYLAGGVESMSRAPYSMARGCNFPKAGNMTIYDTSLGWRYPNPKMETLFPLEAMGCTAENIVERYQISRQEQDQFALHSQKKAVEAQAAGAFDEEIVPIEVPEGRKKTVLFDKDEGPRVDSSIEKLASLRAVFRKGGSVTAGNSSTLNDGSAAMLVCSGNAVKKYDLKPVARIVSCGAAGVDPTIMGIGPVPATQKALKNAGMKLADVDLFELNEAFAAQSIGVLRELPVQMDRVNVHGGAIALGHPLGCSGARILTTLIHALHRYDKSVGLASLCVGVGQGLSLIVEAVDGIR